MQIQWYPGHMNKAFRQMREDIKLIDLLIELCDARIPAASRNPEIMSLSQGKERVILLNKSDLADPRATKGWMDYFAGEGIYAIAVDARARKSLRTVDSIVEKAMENKRKRDERRGIRPRPVRCLVCGIPNSGKSTFINSYAGRAQARTGNKPGVTKGKQWIRPNRQLELLDTPGVLWPKFDDESVGFHLAAVGSIRDEVFEHTDLVVRLIEQVQAMYPHALSDTYELDMKDGHTFLNEFAQRSGSLKSGGEPDLDRASRLLLTDFRSGKWGKLSLEWVTERDTNG